MKQTHICQVVGELVEHRLESDCIAMSDFRRRQQVAETFVLGVLQDKLKKVFGDNVRVTVDGHEFTVRWIINNRSFDVRPRVNSYLCTFRDFPSVEEWCEGAEAQDVVVDFIRRHWRPDHGFHFFVRAGDEYFVAARITAWGLEWQRIRKDQYEEWKADRWEKTSSK